MTNKDLHIINIILHIQKIQLYNHMQVENFFLMVHTHKCNIKLHYNIYHKDKHILYKYFRLNTNDQYRIHNQYHLLYKLHNLKHKGNIRFQINRIHLRMLNNHLFILYYM